MKRLTIHPELERKMHLYVNGRLTESQIDELWTEMIQVEGALDYLKTIAAIRQISLDEERRKMERGSGGSVIRLRWSFAAAAVLIIAGLFYLYAPTGDGVSLSPVASIELDYYRSSAGSADPTRLEGVVRQAIVLANEGETLAAVRVIEEEIRRTEHPDEQVQLYIHGGSILYNASRFREAAGFFSEAAGIEGSDPLLRERAWWYLGNSWFQLNNLELAREAFQNAYNLDGAYSRIAWSYLTALADK